MKGLHQPDNANHCIYCKKNVSVANAGTECPKNDGPRHLAILQAAAAILPMMPLDTRNSHMRFGMAVADAEQLLEIIEGSK